MRVLIVKLSSLGDVVHAMPAVHDIQAARPGAAIDWIVEPGFAPLVRRVDGVDRVVECALRRWSRSWWQAGTRREWRAFRARLDERAYDAVLDLQGLTKSAVIARLARLAPGGLRYGLANRTEGASHEPPARWLVDRPIWIAPRVHALDRSRRLAAAALGYLPDDPPVFGLRAEVPAGSLAPRTLAFIHGSSRADKLWPEDNWIELGRRAIAAGWRVALPQAGVEEAARAERIAAALRLSGPALGGWSDEAEATEATDARADVPGNACDTGAKFRAAVEVWPALPLDAVVDRLAATGGAIGVDSGLSHIAVALGLPHVQLYNWPTAWRTGPLEAHGHRAQVAVEAAGGVPSVEAVWAAWQQVLVAPPPAPAVACRPMADEAGGAGSITNAPR